MANVLNKLETAACLWEAVLDLQNASGAAATLAEQIQATREAIGTAALRFTVIGWSDAVDAAWQIADTDPTCPGGGQYGGAFDWEFIPEWIVANVDWSNPQGPTVRKPSPLDALAPDLRAWLVGEMGMEVELGGGGCTYLRHEGPNGSHLLVTCEGGGGMPTADSWQVGAYRTVDSEGELNFYSSDAGSTLRGAVDDACEFLSTEPDASDLSKATGLIVSGLELLDDVEFVTAGAECDDAGSFVTADGTTYLFTVERFTPHAAAQEA